MPLPIGILPRTQTSFEETAPSIQSILQNLQQQKQDATLGRATQDPEAAQLFRLVGNDPEKLQQLLALRNIANPNPNLTQQQLEAQQDLAKRLGKGQGIDIAERLKLKKGQEDLALNTARAKQYITKTQPKDIENLERAKEEQTNIQQLAQLVNDPEAGTSKPITAQLASSFFGQDSPIYKQITGGRGGQGALFEAINKRLLLGKKLPSGARLTNNLLNVLQQAVPTFGNSRLGQQLVVENLGLVNQEEQNRINARTQAIQQYQQEQNDPNAFPPDLQQRTERVFREINAPVEKAKVDNYIKANTYSDILRLKRKTNPAEQEVFQDNIQSILDSARTVLNTNDSSTLLKVSRAYRDLARNKSTRGNLNPATVEEDFSVGKPFIVKGKKYALYSTAKPGGGFQYEVDEYEE